MPKYFNKVTDQGFYDGGYFSTEELAKYRAITAHDITILKEKVARNQASNEEQYDLAICYRFGFGGCRIDNDKFFAIVERLSKKSDERIEQNTKAKSCFQAASYYYKDPDSKLKKDPKYDVHKRLDKTRELFKIAVDKNYEPAKIKNYFFQVIDQKVSNDDFRVMVEFHREMIAKGCAPARYDLYLLRLKIINNSSISSEYINGLISDDESQAILLHAAEDGDHRAQERLAHFYEEKGEMDVAFSYYELAAAQDYQDSIEKFLEFCEQEKCEAAKNAAKDLNRIIYYKALFTTLGYDVLSTSIDLSLTRQKIDMKSPFTAEQIITIISAVNYDQQNNFDKERVKLIEDVFNASKENMSLGDLIHISKTFQQDQNFSAQKKAQLKEVFHESLTEKMENFLRQNLKISDRMPPNNVSIRGCQVLAFEDKMLLSFMIKPKKSAIARDESAPEFSLTARPIQIEGEKYPRVFIFADDIESFLADPRDVVPEVSLTPRPRPAAQAGAPQSNEYVLIATPSEPGRDPASPQLMGQAAAASLVRTSSV